LCSILAVAEEKALATDDECAGVDGSCSLSLRALRGEVHVAKAAEHVGGDDEPDPGTTQNEEAPESEEPEEVEEVSKSYPLANTTEESQTYPMTTKVSGFCAFPSERSSPLLGGSLGASPDASVEVCTMAQKYEGHRAAPGSECATEKACAGCNGVWCDGKMTSLAELSEEEEPESTGEAPESEEPEEVEEVSKSYPLANTTEESQTYPMTTKVSGFCAFPSERSSPLLGGSLGASPDASVEVCTMAQKYEGHRAAPGSECATEKACAGCNGVWCDGKMTS